MKVKIHSKKVDFKLKAAIHSMCGYAISSLGISNRISKNLNLTIHMGHHVCEGEARVAKDANRYRPRDFKIYLDHHRMDIDDYNRTLEGTEWGHRVLRTLAHELVHVKQYIRGELTWRDRGLLWKGVDHNPKNLLHYYDLPYEIEANGREYGLLFGFLLVWTGLEKKFEKELNNLV